MNKFALLCAAALTVIPFAAQAQDADPMAPARAGKLLCYFPDTNLKMCGILAHFTFYSNGTIDDAIAFMLKPNDATVMKTHSPAKVSDGALCGITRKQDIDNGIFYYGGVPVPDDQVMRKRVILEDNLKSKHAFDGVTCSKFEADDTGFTLHPTFTANGYDVPLPPQHVIWVDPKDGYTVAGTPPD